MQNISPKISYRYPEILQKTKWFHSVMTYFKPISTQIRLSWCQNPSNFDIG